MGFIDQNLVFIVAVAIAVFLIRTGLKNIKTKAGVASNEKVDLELKGRYRWFTMKGGGPGLVIVFFGVVVFMFGAVFGRSDRPSVPIKKQVEQQEPVSGNVDSARVEIARNLRVELQQSGQDPLLQRDIYRNALEIQVDGEAIEGTLLDWADNWYRFNVIGGLYVIQTQPITTLQDRDIDTEITLYRGDGRTEIGYDDDGGTGWYSRLAGFLEGGDYVLRVSSYNQVEGEYSLLVRSVNEYQNLHTYPQLQTTQLQTTQLQTNGQLVSGSLGEGATTVWYELNVEQDGNYEIVTIAPGEGPGVDTLVRLYFVLDDELMLINENDDSNDDRYSMLSEYLQAGAYYVSVTSYYGDPGGFQIIADRVQDSEDDTQ